jgi:hypothetical protein
MNMKKGQLIRVNNEGFKAQVAFMEVMFLGNDKPDFYGEIVAVNPTREEFAKLDDNFSHAVESGMIVEEVLEGKVVYFDAGANRAFLLGTEDVELLS